MMNRLEMPDAVSGVSIQSKEAVCEEVVADPVGTVEVRGRRPGRHIDNAALYVHRHPRPVVSRAAVRPRVFGPGVVSVFAGVRNRVEGPPNRAGTNVIG